MLTYTIRHAFAHEGTYYTAANADEVKALPRAVRDEHIKLGFLVESDDRKTAAEPDEPATTTRKAGK